MARPWLRLDAHMDEHPRIAELRDGLRPDQADAACWAFVRLLMAAKRADMGEFRTEAHLKAVMGASCRWLPRLRAVGLLEGLAVRDWSHYQVDATAAERQRRHRDANGVSRMAKRDSHEPVTTDSTKTVHGQDMTNNPLPPAHRYPQGGAPVRLGDIIRNVVKS